MTPTPERDHAKVREARREILDARDAALRDISQANAERLDRAWNAYDALLSLAAPQGGEDGPNWEGFVRDMFADHDRGDWDGGEIQDVAEKHGVLIRTTVTEPCDPEYCACAEYDAFPLECFRLAALAAPKGGEDALEVRRFEMLHVDGENNIYPRVNGSLVRYADVAAVVERNVAPWRDLATHQSLCRWCSEGDCEDGKALKDAARAASPEGRDR